MSADISFKIIGTDLQYVEFYLPPKQSITSIQNVLLYKDVNIKSELKQQEQNISTKNSFLKKLLYGENHRIVEEHLNEGNNDSICCIEPKYYGQIFPINLEDLNGSRLILHKNILLCAIGKISITNAPDKKLPDQNNNIKRMDQMEGNGTVFLQSEGIIIKRELTNQETLFINSSNNLLGFTETIHCESEETKPSRIKKILANRPTHTKVSGPGTIWIQTTSLSKTRENISGQLNSSEKGYKRPKNLLERLFK